MIIQDIDTDTKLVYVDNPETDYRTVGAEFGICDRDGNASTYSDIRRGSFQNSNSVAMDSVILTGKTLSLYVVKDHVSGVHTPSEMSVAMNWFHQPMYSYDRYVFHGKFKPSSVNVVLGRDNRGFNMSVNNIKDMDGIYGLMANIGVNNGKLFEPLLCRYVTAMRATKGTEVKAVGYFDLGEYLLVMRDYRADLFSEQYNMTRNTLVISPHDSGCTVRVSTIDRKTGNAVLAMDGVTIYDGEKTRNFRPHVIISTAPLHIRDEMIFPSTKVMYGKLPLFLTPMISKPEVWHSLTGGINLLTAAIY